MVHNIRMQAPVWAVTARANNARPAPSQPAPDAGRRADVRKCSQVARVVSALLAAALCSGCDCVYFARIDVGPYDQVMGTIPPLTTAEVEQCVAAFTIAAKELGLDCQEGEYPIIRGSYPANVYRLTECRKQDDYTQIQLAVADHHLSVEMQDISGSTEPAEFRQYRLKFSERLRAVCGDERVTVRYPYDWGGDTQ